MSTDEYESLDSSLVNCAIAISDSNCNRTPFSASSKEHYVILSPIVKIHQNGRQGLYIA